MEVPIHKIKSKNRIRKDLGDLEPLKNSIQQHGLFHPILVDENYNLISGQRRLAALESLGFSTVDIKIISAKSSVKKVIIELEENSCRRDFSPEEWAIGKKRLVEIARKGIFWRIYYFFVNLLRSLFDK